jgi:carbonic anhydrase/acetyltransferase-like protein (isoleucine patch superfamily)
MSFLNSLNGYLDIPNANLRVNGSGQFSSINVGSTRILAGYDLDTVTSVGSITPYTIEFSNATTGIVTTSNGQIGGDLTVLGNAAVSSNLTVAGNATVSSNLTVAGNATVSSNLTVAGNATVSSNLTVAGNATVSSNLTVAGNATVSGDATVSSNLTVAGNTTVSSNLILNEDLFLVGNTQFNVNSKVVTEFTGPHGRPQATLTKFPEIQMTEAAQAGYVVSASSTLQSNVAYYAFDDDIGATSGQVNVWLSGSASYNTSGGGWLGGTGAAYTTTVGGTSYYGEWIQLKTPNGFIVSYADMYPPTHASNDWTVRTPKVGKLVGSNDGTTWYLLKDFTVTQPPETGYARIDVTTTTSYTYFRLVIEGTFGGTDGDYTSLAELKLFGTPQVETAGNISQDTTLKSIYNTPSNLDANVYLDGDLGATLTNQISGGPALTGTGATYDSAGKYWSLDGSTESNVVTGDLAFQGDQPHSVSLWFNSSNLEANVANSTIYHIGTAATTGDATHKVRIVNKSLSWNYENDIPLKANTWHHLTHTYEGVGGYRTLYLDGRKVESAYAGDTAGEYPPFPMSGYSQGGYTVTSSSEWDASYAPWKAIDDNTGSYWSSGPIGSERYLKNSGGIWNTTYNTADFLTSVGGTSYYGEWLEIEMPQKIYPYFFTILRFSTQPLRAPGDGVLVGCNDEEKTWELVGSFSGLTNIATAHVIETTVQNKAYKRFRFVITKIIGGDTDGDGGFLALGELEIHGHKENDLIRFPDATNVRKYPDTAMTSNGPQRGYTVSTSSDFDSVARPVHFLFNGRTNSTSADVDAWMSENATNYAGTDLAYSGSRNLGTGAVNGEWIKIEMPYKLFMTTIKMFTRYNDGNSRPEDFKVYGSNDNSNWTEVLSETNNPPPTENGNSVGKVYTADTTSTAYKYFGLVVTKLTGHNTFFGLQELEFYGTQESTPVLARLGGSFEGKIANTRVYDRSIGERQVLEVWDAEKDRFGRGESSITVHKGRLGVGTKTPQATLDVRGNIFGPLLTHRSYVWRKPVITYVPAAQECRILAQVVEIPEMYKNISPLNLRLSYKWVWFGESSAETYYTFWRTNVKHSGNTVEHMNTGKEGGRPYGVSMSLTSIYTGDDASTPEGAIIPGSYELKNVTGDTFEVELSMSPTAVMTLYTNRTVDATDGNDYERGCSTLTVFMEPY